MGWARVLITASPGSHDCTRLACRSRAARDVQRAAFQKAMALAKGFPGAQLPVPGGYRQHVETGMKNLHVAARCLTSPLDEAVLERLWTKPASPTSGPSAATRR